MAAFDARMYEPVMTHGDVGDENLIVDEATGLLGAVSTGSIARSAMRWTIFATSSTSDATSSSRWLTPTNDGAAGSSTTSRCGSTGTSDTMRSRRWDGRRRAARCSTRTESARVARAA